MAKRNPSYHLKMGLVVAAMFPAFFLLTDPYADHFVNRFLCSFCFILILWLINTQLARHWATLVFSFVLAVLVYLCIGYSIDNTGLLLRQVSSHQPAPAKAWSFLVARLVLLDGMVIFIRYLYGNLLEKKAIAFENEILKTAQLQARHETLKQQVSPHFLFNSLNTLGSLIKQNTADAISFTRELSSVYRYMLVHQDKAMVPLKDELGFLKSYFYLLDIRFAGAIRSSISVDVSCLESLVPPNTLQLLIENAVKHNAFSAKKPLCISITNYGSYLKVTNNVHAKPPDNTSSGIGLGNIQARYQLAAGGKKIVIEKTEDQFQVLLPIIASI